jgi:hypothetical protein
VCPVEQAHAPRTQREPVGQAWPHAPQCCASEWISTQTSSQLRRGATHAHRGEVAAAPASGGTQLSPVEQQRPEQATPCAQRLGTFAARAITPESHISPAIDAPPTSRPARAIIERRDTFSPPASDRAKSSSQAPRSGALLDATAVSSAAGSESDAQSFDRQPGEWAAFLSRPSRHYAACLPSPSRNGVCYGRRIGRHYFPMDSAQDGIAARATT